jgi:hypothetical protein
MDTVLKPREPSAPDLEAGPTISASHDGTADTKLPEIHVTPNDEETVPWVREFLWFPDGETKEECQARFFDLAEELVTREYIIRIELCGIPN